MTLSEARRLTGLTQKALAEAADCSPADIVDLERGKNKNPSHALVIKIVRAFQQHGLAGLTAEDLFPVSVAS
jgi:DNA-binding XRE family transcriptional regulator